MFATDLHAAQDYEISSLLLVGDPVPGLGWISSPGWVTVNNSGSWVSISSAGMSPSEAVSVRLRDGVVDLEDGQLLPAPPDATLQFIGATYLNSAGASASHLKFVDPLGSQQGLFFGTEPLIQSGDLSTAAGFAAGTTYLEFGAHRFADDGSILVNAAVDDPSIASGEDRALVVLGLDASGALVSETVLVKEGDVLPGQSAPVADVVKVDLSLDLNDVGQALYAVRLATPTSANEHAVYLDQTLLAQEGDLEPSTGRHWTDLSWASLALNNAGDWVMGGFLDGDPDSDYLIIKNGEKFLQEGDTLPAFAPFGLTKFGQGDPAYLDIDDDGNVLWYGQWDNPDAQFNSGVFLNDTPLVLKGLSTVDGRVLTELFPGSLHHMSMSDNGRYVTFRALLGPQGHGSQGVFRLRVKGKIQSIDGCSEANLGELSVASGEPLGGETLTFEMDEGPSAGAGAVLLISLDTIVGWPTCGIHLGGPGELLIDLLPPNPIAISSGIWTGTPVPFPVPVPASTALIGATFYAQGVFADPSSPVEPFRLTNAFEIELGDFQ